jgi:hypothetical protein
MTQRAGRALPFVKELGRLVFHRFIRLALNTPGGRPVSRLIYRLAPVPVEWLARRYRAYDGRYDVGAQPPTALFSNSAVPSIAPFPAGAPDLSDAEGRLYRQFASFGPGHPIEQLSTLGGKARPRRDPR